MRHVAALNIVKQHFDVGMVYLPNVVGPLKIMLNVIGLVYLLAG